MELPPLRTQERATKKVVGFATSSPSSVLRDSPPNDGRQQGLESPLSSALKRELSMPQLNAGPPALPKLKLGLGRAKMPRSRSHGNLLATQPAAVPAVPPKQHSAASSPHAASSGGSGSEPVRIPLELKARRRTHSVDFAQPGGAPGSADDEDMASTPLISAASSLLGHHLTGGLPAGAGSAAAAAAAAAQEGSAAGSPLSGGGSHLARDLFAAQADAVMAHAQVQTLQAALRKEQKQASRLREQLQLMTAERDRLLTELQAGGAAPLFDMDQSQLLPPLDASVVLPPRPPGAAPPPQQQQQGLGGLGMLRLR